MKRTARVTLLLVMLLLPRAGTVAWAAEARFGLPTVGATLATANVAVTATVAQEGTASGLPERAPAPRTLRAYWHLFIAFAVTWLLVFGYALTLGRRFGRLEEELRRARAGGLPNSGNG